MIGLHWLDYLIFVAFLLASLAIGVYHSMTGGKQRTTQEFIMANRKLGVLPTAMSFVASYHSAIMILGQTAEMYSWGIQMWVIGVLVYSLATLVSERLFVPWIYPLKLTSSYEYLAMRFDSRAVAMLGACIGVLKATLYMGIAIYSPSIALESVCGLPASISIPLMAVLCTIYTALGGMRAVIWTDVLQCAIMLAGMLVVLIKGAIDVGGLQSVFAEAEKHGRLNWINLSLSPYERHTVWNITLGLLPLWAVIYGLQQASVQRYSATKSLAEARMTIFLMIPASAVLMSIASVTGLVALAYFSKIQCDPIANGEVQSSNQVLTHFVNIIFFDVRGFSGLFLATLYSGALSSISSSLSGCAANMWDCVLKHWLGHISEFRAAMLNKGLVIIFGSLAAGLAFLASTMPGPVSQISATFGGAAGGPLMGIFIIGGCFPFIEKYGVMVGAVTGLTMNLWIGIGARTVPPLNHPLPPVSTEGCGGLTTNYWLNHTAVTDTMDYTTMSPTTPGVLIPSQLVGLARLYAISYLWYAPIGGITTIITAFIVSAVARCVCKVKPEPVARKLLICWRAALTCGTHPHEEDYKQEDKQVYKQEINTVSPDMNQGLEPYQTNGKGVELDGIKRVSEKVANQTKF